MADLQPPLGPETSSKEPASSLVPDGGLFHTRRLQEDLLSRIEARLALVPASAELHMERAQLLAELLRPEESALAYRKAVELRAPPGPPAGRAYCIVPCQGKRLPVTVLLLGTPGPGNAPLLKYLDNQTFLTLHVVMDRHDPGLSLPPHQLVINNISEADSSQAALEAASALLRHTQAPVINLPSQVSATGRESIARHLTSIPGVRTPRIATFPREFFADEKAAESLRRNGFVFPLLLRSPGYHTGEHFVRVETSRELPPALRDLPGSHLSAIEYMDARNADGRIRKYRVMMIDGRLYPAHLAISEAWKVHYFSADMADFPEHRAEDRDFLENMPRVLGPRVMEALGRIQAALKLDYAGIDFSLGAGGEILVFEANATMTIYPPGEDERWSYRRAPVQRIADAIRTMLLDRAKENYLNLLMQDPAQIAAVNQLAAALNTKGHSQVALKIHRDVVARNPDNPQAHVNLAHALRESGKLEEARLHYEAALRLAPDLAEARQGLSHVPERQGK